MPALSPEQRKRQRQLQIQREEEYARAMAPRRGSKAARSSMKGATTKGETVGGAKPKQNPPNLLLNPPKHVNTTVLVVKHSLLRRNLLLLL